MQTYRAAVIGCSHIGGFSNNKISFFAEPPGLGADGIDRRNKLIAGIDNY